MSGSASHLVGVADWMRAHRHVLSSDQRQQGRPYGQQPKDNPGRRDVCTHRALSASTGVRMATARPCRRDLGNSLCDYLRSAIRSASFTQARAGTTKCRSVDGPRLLAPHPRQPRPLGRPSDAAMYVPSSNRGVAGGFTKPETLENFARRPRAMYHSFPGPRSYNASSVVI
jgi:hypothetical protein